MPIHILNINPGSDGDGRRRPKTDDFTRNDEHWLVRIGQIWAEDQGIAQKGWTYKLDRLPDGYGGYEKSRGSDSKHVDRYVYGHERGPARSVPDFKDHFLHLMNRGTAVGCTCKLCSGGSRNSGGGGGASAARRSSVSTQGAASGPSPHFAQQPKKVGRPPKKPVPYSHYQSDAGVSTPVRRTQVDEEGTPDALRHLLDKLEKAGAEGKVDERIVESMSPDWRAGHADLMKTLKDSAKLPGYVPRAGELVLFVRNLGEKDVLGWDSAYSTWRIIPHGTKSWGDRPVWEAGVVTQLPTEAVSARDLLSVPDDKQKGVVEAGFRVEPMSMPNSVKKTLTKQHRYVHLHAIRPLAYWKECVGGTPEENWHPTLRHALVTASSFCVLAKFHFKGVWPEATIFAQGIYIGAELVTIGDAVRLLAKNPSQEHITEVMIITAIKVRIVNLDEASNDDYDDQQPYMTCTHISGHTFTRDARRSFDGVGKMPLAEGSEALPAALAGSGTWYHVTDPKNPRARIEIPFQRVAGRWHGSTAVKTWFTAPSDIAPPNSFQAVNTKPSIKLNDKDVASDSAFSASGIIEARAYSQQNDTRIDRDNGMTWFWADTRVQQLDLHEVNGRRVGVRDEERAKDVPEWRKALKALDGKRGGLEEYHAARREREQAQAQRVNQMATSGMGIVAGGAQTADEPATEAERTSGADEEDEEEAEIMEIDQPVPMIMPAGGRMEVDDDDDDDSADGGAEDALAAFKGAPTQGRAPEVIMLDD